MNLEQTARDVYTTLRAGGLAVVPTTAGYGLLAATPGAVARIYTLKGRPTTKPCVTVTPWEVFDDVAADIDPALRAWITRTTRWAPLAVVAPLRPSSRLLGGLPPFVRDQCTQDDTIATFHRAGAIVQRVAEIAWADGRLVVGSSGNRSGCGNAYTLAEVPARFEADRVVDVGDIPIPGGTPLATTILDLRTGRFLREGLHFAGIRASWRGHLARQAGGWSAAA